VEISDRVCSHATVEFHEIDTKRLDRAVLCVEAIHDAGAQDELVPEGVLGEWNVVVRHCRKQTMDRFISKPCRSKRMPLRADARTTHVQAPMIGDVSIRPEKQRPQRCG
jgi:hypothetical protein